MEEVVTGMPKYTNAMALRWAAIGNAVAEPFPPPGVEWVRR